MTNEHIPTVLIALPLAFQDGRDKYNGMMRFLKEKKVSWHIRLDRVSPSIIRPTVGERGNFDGAIIDGGASTGLAKAYAELKIPLVAMDWRHPEIGYHRRRLVYVDTDNAEIGRAAAKALFETSNFVSFAYLPLADDVRWSMERGKAFSGFLRRHAITPVMLSAQKPLDKQLLALPKPAAVFAANDELGALALSVCRRCGLSVPENLSILGVDNELLTCLHSAPPLASIGPDFEKAGYLAAAALNDLFEQKNPHLHQLYHVRAILPRQSMEPPGTSGRLVQRAMELIRNSDSEIANINDLADRLGISRRLLDLRFREIQSRSVLEAIKEVRMEKVCAMLESTNIPIAEICKASNLGSGTYPLRSFRKRFGITMYDYRAEHRRKGAEAEEKWK